MIAAEQLVLTHVDDLYKRMATIFQQSHRLYRPCDFPVAERAHFFVFPDTSILDFGYATLDSFFGLAPWILLFLVPTVTMRSLADEYKTGTFEILKTLPLSSAQLVWDKFAGALLVVVPVFFKANEKI